MAQKGFLIGPQLVAKIKETIARVDGMPYGGGASQIPTRLEAVTPYVPKPIRVAAYPRDTFWRKGETQQVTFYTHNGTQYGLATLDASGTATAVNICNDLPPVPSGISDQRLGPTPTMTWVIIGESRGGAKVVAEGQQAGTFMAAYPVAGGEWGTGQTRNVAYYFRSSGVYRPTGFVATAVNIGSPYKPLIQDGNAGPTPTMAWCVVATTPDGGLAAVEAQQMPETRWGTIDSASIGDPWERKSTRTAVLPATGETVSVVSVFDYYSPLDLPHGLAFTRGISPDGNGTANVVIGPPPVPLHSVTYTGTSEWGRGESRVVDVLPSAGVTQSRSVTAINPYYDSVEAGDKPLAIGKMGTAYHVMTSNQKVFRVCTATGAWAINTQKTLAYYGVTGTPSTVAAINRIINLPAPSGTTTSRIVNIAKDGTQWYLISFQMSSKTAVFATAAQTMTYIGAAATQRVTFVGTAATQTMTVLGTAATQRLTFAVPGSAVSVITGISASISTADCTVVIRQETASVSTVGSTQTATTISASATQTATMVSMSGTQTATVVSMSGTQTAVIMTGGTFTATYITLEI